MLSSTPALTSMSLLDQMVIKPTVAVFWGIELGKGSPLVNVPMYVLYILYICFTRVLV